MTNSLCYRIEKSVLGGFDCSSLLLQVKIAEHVLTGHKVAIKILHRKKIRQMEMEEKGRFYHTSRMIGLLVCVITLGGQT